jgi:membrane protease YdiL (CAAX protease family)
MNQLAGEPRTGGTGRRIVQSAPVRLILGIIWLMFVLVVGQVAVLAAGGNAFISVLAALAAAVVSLLAYAGFVRLLEGRPVSELSLLGAGREFLAGVALGAVLFSLTIGVVALFGGYQVTGTHAWTVVLPALAISITSGVMEELLFRGILFRIIEEGLGSLLALIISGLIFGLLHLTNPNASLVAGLAIAIEAGILLAAVYMLTRRLWLAIGLHLAWNLTQGGIYGVAVSGNEMEGLLDSTLTGPEWLSGGAFGAEASIVAVVVCLAASALVLWRVRQRRGWVAPFWARRSRA